MTISSPAPTYFILLTFFRVVLLLKVWILLLLCVWYSNVKRNSLLHKVQTLGEASTGSSWDCTYLQIMLTQVLTFLEGKMEIVEQRLYTKYMKLLNLSPEFCLLSSLFSIVNRASGFPILN